MTMNKSPSVWTLNRPPQASVKLLAMDSPRPLPSVVRFWSPRTKRAVRWSASMVISLREMFRIITVARPPPAGLGWAVKFTYTREPSRAYWSQLRIRFWNTRYSRWPSAWTSMGVSGISTRQAKVDCRKSSSISPKVCCSSLPMSRSSKSREMFPVAALDTSNTSCTMWFSRSAFWEMVLM